MSAQNQPQAIDFLCLTSEEWNRGDVTRPMPKGEIAFEVADEKTIYILKGDGYPPNAGATDSHYERLRIDFFEYPYTLGGDTKTLKQWIAHFVEEDERLESLIRDNAEAIDQEAERLDAEINYRIQADIEEAAQREQADLRLHKRITQEKQERIQNDSKETQERIQNDSKETQERQDADLRLHKRITRVKDEQEYLYDLTVGTSGEFLLMTDCDKRNDYPYNWERKLDADHMEFREIDNLSVYDIKNEFVTKDQWLILDDLVMSSAGEYLVAIDITQARTQAGEYELRILDRAAGYKIEYRDYDRDKDTTPMDVMRYGDFVWEDVPPITDGFTWLPMPLV